MIVSSYVTTINAQCKVEVDEFTKDVTISNSMAKIGKNYNGKIDIIKFLSAQVYKLNSTFVLVLVPQFLDIQTIREGEIVYIKFTDESVIKLNVLKTSISKYTSGEMFIQGSSTTIWYNYLSFVLSDSDIQNIKTKKISKIRCGINDYKIKKRDSNILSEQLNCIINR
jgi:hypothetical protein